MNTAPAISFQCELCFAYCDASGGRLMPQPRFGYGLGLPVPDLLTCAVCKINPPMKSTEGSGARGQVSGKKMRAGNRPASAAAGPVGIERSQPPERDDLRKNYSEPVPNSEFKAMVDTSSGIGILMEHLRKHFGAWFPMVELAELTGCHALHSRIPEARVLIQEDEDIDQENRLYGPTGKLHSFYRLCLRSESVRLQREAARRARGGEATTGHYQGGNNDRDED